MLLQIFCNILKLFYHSASLFDFALHLIFIWLLHQFLYCCNNGDHYVTSFVSHRRLCFLPLDLRLGALQWMVQEE